MSVMFLVVGNLALAFAQQLLVALVLGGADMDVLLMAQAPFLMVASAGSSVLANVFTPRFAAGPEASRGVSVASVHAPVLWSALSGFAALALIAPVTMPLFVADRVAAHPHFVAALVISGAGAAGTTIATLHGAWLVAQRRQLVVEMSQLACALVAIALSVPLAQRWGVAGAASALALRGVLQASILQWMLWRSGDLEARAAPRPTQLLREAARMVPTHLLLKSSPLLDRSLLTHADVSYLTVYSLVVQVVGGVLGIYDKAVTRDLLVRLGRNANDAEYRQVFGRVAWMGCGAVVVGHLVWMFADAFVPFRPEYWPTQEIVSFALFSVWIGILAQVSSAALYATRRFGLLSTLSVGSMLVSAACRILLFMYFGLPGFLVGVVVYTTLNALFFHATIRRHPLRPDQGPDGS